MQALSTCCLLCVSLANKLSFTLKVLCFSALSACHKITYLVKEAIFRRSINLMLLHLLLLGYVCELLAKSMKVLYSNDLFHGFNHDATWLLSMLLFYWTGNINNTKSTIQFTRYLKRIQSSNTIFVHVFSIIDIFDVHSYTRATISMYTYQLFMQIQYF